MIFECIQESRSKKDTCSTADRKIVLTFSTLMAVNLLVIVCFVRRRKIPYVLELTKLFHWTKGFFRRYLEKCFPILCNETLIGVGNMPFFSLLF